MPVTFDFVNTGPINSYPGPGPQTGVNTADGVKFTVSSDAAGGTERIFFGNTGSVNAPLILDDRGSGGQNDIFTLRFESTVNTLNDALSGTALNPVKIAWGGTFGRGSYQIQFLTTGGDPVGTTVVNPATPGTANVVNSAINGIRFTSISAGTGIDRIILTSLSANAGLQCYLAGTRIATRDGAVAVEALQPGDRILTADGRETTVKWLGEQPVNTRLTHPSKVNPICIRAGALADGVPARDLFVTADHALCLDGLLINAGALVNGETIYQVAKMPLDGFTYYHVETDAHELILAEGCAAESFIDYAGCDSFVNGDERPDAPLIQEMDLPRISAVRLLPEALRVRLHERGEAMTGTRRFT